MQQFREAQCVPGAPSASSSSMLFALHHGEGERPAVIFDEHVRFGEALQRKEGPPAAAWPNDRTPGRRLRVGYTSPDFRRHPVGFFITPVLEAHDRTALELFAYGNDRAGDDVQTRVRAAVDHFVDVTGWSDARLAARVADSLGLADVDVSDAPTNVAAVDRILDLCPSAR
jgi:predicted O-linked N-acetylglucosamine transferase (SPINDLY family)